MDDKNLTGLFDLVRSLESEVAERRTALAKVTEDLKQARDLLARLRGGAVSIPATDAAPVLRAHGPKSVAAAKKQRVPKQKLSLSSVQTSLVKFAKEHNDVFTTDQAMQHLIRNGVVHARTSTTIVSVRRILNDPLFFIRTGERGETRYIYNQSTNMKEA